MQASGYSEGICVDIVKEDAFANFWLVMAATTWPAGHFSIGQILTGPSYSKPYCQPEHGITRICVTAGTITLFRVGPGIVHDQLRQLFMKFGEVKSVRDCPDQPGNCLVDFFDTRHAAAAYQAIDRPGQALALQPQPQLGLHSAGLGVPSKPKEHVHQPPLLPVPLTLRTT